MDVEVEYDQIVHETASAILFVIDPESPQAEEFWLAKSTIVDHDEDSKTVTIPEWLAKDKGLI